MSNEYIEMMRNKYDKILLHSYTGQNPNPQTEIKKRKKKKHKHAQEQQ